MPIAPSAATPMPFQLLRPSHEHLHSYICALERGWSADSERGAAAAHDELQRIARDPAAFLAGMEDREGAGPPVTLPDGTSVARLPGIRRFMWDGEFAGSIGLRWQRDGSPSLPDYCLGHIGYAVVPWRRRRGYASRALRLMLDEARALGLPYVEVTADPDNIASRTVIETAGGVLHEHFIKPPQFGSRPGVRYRIALAWLPANLQGVPNMPKSPEDAKPESWHHYFAASANNRAWQLAELPPGEVNVREVLDAAHAAAWHWQVIGTQLHHMRALMLLAQAHAMAGLGVTALAYADEMRTFFLAAPDTPDWELAFTHAVHARAASAAGAAVEHAQSYARAVLALAAIADEEDRKIVERVFRHVPAPAH